MIFLSYQSMSSLHFFLRHGRGMDWGRTTGPSFVRSIGLSFNYVGGKHDGNNITHDMEKKIVHIHITIHPVGWDPRQRWARMAVTYYKVITTVNALPPASPVDEQVRRESSPCLSGLVLVYVPPYSLPWQALSHWLRGCLVRTQYLFGHRAVQAQSRNRLVLKLSI